MPLPTPFPTQAAASTRQQRAFTLIELLVVVVIIGILIAVAAPSFLGQQDEAHDSEIKQALTLAYKVSKADSTERNGRFAPNAETALAAIVRSEPHLSSRIGTSAAPDSGSLGICSADSDSIVFVGLSKSGTSFRGTASRSGWTIETGGCDGRPNDETQLSTEEFVQLSDGGTYNCGLRPDHTIACWGDMNGDPTPPAGRFAKLPSNGGSHHNCALRDDATAECWGWNAFGQTDVPDPTERFVETLPSPDASYTCGLRLDRQLRCWGDFDGSYHSVQGLADIPTPVGGFKAVALGNSTACGLRMDGTALCWGANDAGQATPPSSDTRYTTVATKGSHACALREDGTAECWGENSYGQATPPEPAQRYTSISVGTTHTCALRDDGTAECWGSNIYGESSVPFPDEQYASIRPSMLSTCALRVDGRVRCWGTHNPNGQLNLP